MIASYSALANVGTGWNVSGVGDFNGDGKTDVLWRDTAGSVAIWLMDGLTVADYSTIANVWTGWTIAGVGDFNGDGKSDILWLSSFSNFGSIHVWLMNGYSISARIAVGPTLGGTGWTIPGTGDFNGDGNTDLVLRDKAGNMVIWLMDGPNIFDNRAVGSTSGRMSQN